LRVIPGSRCETKRGPMREVMLESMCVAIAGMVSPEDRQGIARRPIEMTGRVVATDRIAVEDRQGIARRPIEMTGRVVATDRIAGPLVIASATVETAETAKIGETVENVEIAGIVIAETAIADPESRIVTASDPLEKTGETSASAAENSLLPSFLDQKKAKKTRKFRENPRPRVV